MDSLVKVHDRAVKARQFTDVLASKSSALVKRVLPMSGSLIRVIRQIALFNVLNSDLESKNCLDNLLTSLSWSASDEDGSDGPGLTSDVEYGTWRAVCELMKKLPLQIVIECADIYLSDDALRTSILNFVPAKGPIPFFAWSTLPSVFGCGWCVEQKLAYEKTVVVLLKKRMEAMRSKDAEAFSGSYIIEVIKAFMGIADVSLFMHDVVVRFVQRIRKGFGGNTEEVVNIADSMMRCMMERVDVMPSIVIKLFADARLVSREVFGDDTKEEKLVMSTLLVDGIIGMTLMYPRESGLVEETSLDISGFSEVHDVWRLSACSYRGCGEVPVELMESAMFRDLPLSLLIDAIASVNVDELEMDGIYGQDVQAAGNTACHWYLASVNDALFLSHIVGTTVDRLGSDAGAMTSVKQIIAFEGTYGAGVGCRNMEDLWCKLVRLPEISKPRPSKKDYELPLPFIKAELPKELSSEFTSLVLQILKIFENSRSSPKDDETLSDFLLSELAEAVETGNDSYAGEIMLLRLKLKSDDVNDSILSCVDQMVKAGGQHYPRQAGKTCLTNQVLYDLAAMKELEIVRRQRLSSFVCGKIVDCFVDQDVIRTKLKETSSKEALLVDANEWSSLFAALCDDLTSYAGSADSTTMRRHLHSIVTSYIPFCKFSQVNADRYLSKDDAAAASLDVFIRLVRSEKSSSPLIDLFDGPMTCEPVKTIIASINDLGLHGPMQTLDSVSNVIRVLRDLMELDESDDPDLPTLLSFVIALSKPPRIASLTAWIRHFLCKPVSDLLGVTADLAIFLASCNRLL